jgi:F-type H+-transporting ATPase subunit delta
VIKTSVARRYSKALYDLLEPSAVEPSRVGLTALSQALAESAPLKHVLASPAFSAQEKVEVLSALSQRLGCPPAVNGFLAQLVKKNRAGFIPEIADAFALLADEAKGARQVTVASAAALTPAAQEALRTRLRDLLHSDVDLNFQTDPRLLSGLRIRIGSMLVDSTVGSRLAAMRALLTKE